MLHIYVDADACPVKQEVYRVAERCGLSVTLVANSTMRVPDEEWISLVIVSDAPDAADDWIAETAGADDIVVTADIPLAHRCVRAGAQVVGPTGKPFSESNIGDAVATRNLFTELRESGMQIGGPPPLTKRDRSRFLQTLDEVVQRIRRQYRSDDG